MGKDLKEKYERVCAIKDKAIGLVEGQLNGDISAVDAKELGEVADIAKDMAELMKLCAEAEYYHKVTEAMDEGSEEEKKYYLNKYIPEYEGKFYTPMHMNNYARQRDSRGRYMYTEPNMYMMDDDWDRSRMYYTSPGGQSSSSGRSSSTNYARDMREGRSGITRRTYMDMKDAGDRNGKTKELEHYMQDLATDISEMIEDMEPNEKTMVKQKLTQLAAKVV